MINYSFIIPHKNTPDLLRKCIDSIPHREDIQIIVVDDNSDTDKVDFEHFPGLNEPCTEVYLTKEGKGAGYARNVGLEHAVGKWIVFADADDFFHTKVLEEAMDSYKNQNQDVVFFMGDSIKLPSGGKGGRGSALNEALKEILRTGDCTKAVLLSIPWRKFFSHKMIKDNNIRFNEVICSNDVVFMGRVAAAAERLVASSLCIYCATEHEGSIITNKSLKNRLVRFYEECENVKILKQTKYKHEPSIYYWHFSEWFHVYKLDKYKAITLIPHALKTVGLPFVNQLFRAKLGLKREH
ncbi:MAG: glycosyltransferase family 2 protein [Paludibacteraceae bacterium]|nr:glycosyltransferase family 2 protein [Paludibacteraceae bacterium]